MSNARVGDLTVEELRAVIRQTVRETLTELLSDVDEDAELEQDLTLRPSAVTELRAFLAVRPTGRPLDDIVSEMGLDD
jgi:hypothetical protein